MGVYNIGGSTDTPPVQMGATFTLNATLYDGSTATRYNLTGYAVRAKVRPRYASTSVVATFTGAVLSSTAGTVRLSLTSSITAALTEGIYVYDAEIYTTAATPTVVRFLEGRCKVTPEVTY